MKFETLREKPVTDIRDGTLRLWVSVTNTKPVIKTIKRIAENDQEEEWIGRIGLVQVGLYFVTDNRNAQSAFEEPLQFKEQIKELLGKLYSQYIVEGCCICGKKDSYYQGYTRKCCLHEYYNEGKAWDENCGQIRNKMLSVLNKLNHKITMLERKSLCNYCKKEYLQIRKDGKFCSIKCRVANHRQEQLK